jgi:hypothetical protein
VSASKSRGTHNSKKKVKGPYVYLTNFRGTNQPQNIIFLDFFWAFLGEGTSKTRQKISKKNLTIPGTFLASEEPTNHVAGIHMRNVPCSTAEPRSQIQHRAK